MGMRDRSTMRQPKLAIQPIPTLELYRACPRPPQYPPNASPSSPLSRRARESVRATDPRLVHGARLLELMEAMTEGSAALSDAHAGPVVVLCAVGDRRSQGAAALL